ARLSGEESLRDDKLRLWGDQFLRDYRLEPNDPQSVFYPIWVPGPPRTPDLPHPPNLNIKVEKENAKLASQQLTQQQQQFGGPGAGAGVEGDVGGGGGGQYYATGGKF
ncbi:MAG: hypothetical protein V2A74_09515, partial [bacterium]